MNATNALCDRSDFQTCYREMSYACAGLLNSMETFFKVLAAIVGVLSAKIAAFLIRAYTLVRPSSPRLSMRQRDANRY